MRRRVVPRRVGAALAGVVGAGVLLAGCGIPATGVVEAGEPAVGVQREVKLYFVQDVGRGSLVAVPRRLPRSPSFGEGVSLLFKGLSPEESKILGLTTQLPAAAPVKVGYADGAVTVEIGVPARKLTPVAVDQIVCTAMAEAAASPGRVPDTVTVLASGAPVPGSPDEAARCAKAAEPPPVTSPPTKTFDEAEPGR